jgi:hypothetical protein
MGRLFQWGKRGWVIFAAVLAAVAVLFQNLSTVIEFPCKYPMLNRYCTARTPTFVGQVGELARAERTDHLGYFLSNHDGQIVLLDVEFASSTAEGDSPENIVEEDYNDRISIELLPQCRETALYENLIQTPSSPTEACTTAFLDIFPSSEGDWNFRHPWLTQYELRGYFVVSAFDVEMGAWYAGLRAVRPEDAPGK